MERLERRINERFPESGLGRLCCEVLNIGKKANDRLAWISRPHIPVRIVAGLIICGTLAGLIKVVSMLRYGDEILNFAVFLQGLDALLGSLFFLTAASASLVTIEIRIKRKRALQALQELRTIAHIIDMHQLTKDPELLLLPGTSTPSSPLREMTAFELSRYFDYCAEMLSLISKVATLYIQEFKDPVAEATVEQIEDLTTGLTQKIWQKTMILNMRR